MNKGFSIVIATLLVSLPIQVQISEFTQAQTTQESKAEADRWLDLGNQQYNKSYYQESIQSYQSALDIYRTLKDSNNEGITLNNLGNSYYSLGQYQKSLDYYQQSLVILQQNSDRKGEGTVLNNLGEAYRMLGQFQQAIELYQQSLVIKKGIGDLKGEGTSLNNLGYAYNSLGQYQKAIEFFHLSLAIKKQIGDRIGEGSSLNNLGLAAYTLGQYQQASDFFQQSLAITRQNGDLDSQGYSLIGLGNVYNSIKQYQQANVFFQQALTIFQQTGDRNGEGNALNNLGLISSKQGQYAQAIAFYQTSLGIFRQIGDRNGQGIALNNLGAIFNKLKQPEIAILFYKQSVNVRESIRKDIRGLGEEEQRSYLDTVAGSYRNLADLLLKQDRILEAQQVLDLLKIQELSDYLQNVRGNSQTTQGIDLQNPEQNIIALANELNLLQKKDREGKLNDSEQQRLTQLVQSERDQNKQFNAFLDSPQIKKLLDQLRRSEDNQNVDIVKYRKLQKDLLSQFPNAVLLYPLILDDRLELVLLNVNTPPLRRTVNIQREQLNRLIIDARSDLQDLSSSDIKQKSQQLYDILIKPFENELSQLKINTIIYAPDGVLRYIPLAALYDGKQWLIEKYRVNNITAESLTAFNSKAISSPRIFAGAFGGKDGETRSGFKGLPASIPEVQQITSLFPNTTSFTEQNFTKNVTETRANSHTILHLATHGKLAIGTPEESFILFGNGDKVTISELKDWQLSNVDLVVLSACQSGLGGKLGTGIEVLGLGYQMQSAGARVAIASLWEVSDAGTQVLMSAFYTELKKGNLSVVEALSRAQIALIKSDKYSHPSYWSAFFAIGNGL